MDDEAAQGFERYVAEGGTLVMSFFSGIVDQNDHIRLGGYPAPFRKLLGLRVEECAPYAPGQLNAISADDGTGYPCELWSDVVDLEGATAIAEYTDGYFAGRPAVTRHAFGKGVAYYLGTRPTTEGMAWLLERACRDAGVEPVASLPEGVEGVRRQSDGVSLLYLLNHQHTPVEIALDSPAHDLLTGQDVSGTLVLGPLGVAILAHERTGGA